MERVKKLCVYCAVKFDEGFLIQPTKSGKMEYGACDSCGAKAAVQEFEIRKRKTAEIMGGQQ